MESYWAQTRAHMMYVHEFNTALAQRFPDLTSQYMSFPQPPLWPAQQHDGEDDAMDADNNTAD